MSNEKKWIPKDIASSLKIKLSNIPMFFCSTKEAIFWLLTIEGTTDNVEIPVTIATVRPTLPAISGPNKLKENGVKTLKWEVTRYLKVSFSLTNFIVVLCGIPLVVFREKNSLSFGIGMSVFVIFGYYAFIKFGQSMGFKGQLSPILSAWIGNIIFLIGGLTLLIKARK